MDPSGAKSASTPTSGEVSASSIGIDPADLPADVLARVEVRARGRAGRLRVGRYVIAGELGRGGMGVVYDAWDPRIERRVALKTVEPDLIPDESEREEVIERFRREIKIIGKLHHHAIVTIYDYGEEPEIRRGEPANIPGRIYYYVMEYLQGRSLARVLRERRMLPDLEAVQIALDMADALRVSHAAGIIHRDVKPSNIFIRDDGRAVLLDFGIAKTPSAPLTKQGQILGTPTYLAPERLREKEEGLDGRADLFSLGVLLYTMLLGEAPFTGASVQDLLDNITKQSHSKVSRTTPGGQALSRVIDRMLAKRPQDRYATADEAVGALRGAYELLQDSTPDVSDLSREEASAVDAEDAGTELATPSEPVPVAVVPRPGDAIGTTPEVALARDTRRLGPVEPPALLPPPRVVEITETNGLEEVAEDDIEEAGLDDLHEEGTDSGSPPLQARSRTDVDVKTEPPPPRRLASLEVEDETIADPGGLAGRPSDSDPPRLRAGSAAHSEQVTEHAPSVTRAPTRASKSRRPRIEASLVDEEDVVVKPAPLESLKPDELPTQTGYPVPPPAAPDPIARPSDPLETDIVRPRKPLKDPAESAPKKAREAPAVQAKKTPDDTDDRDLQKAAPGSAAVARRTFGVGAEGKRRGKGLTPRPEDFDAIKVSGTDLDRGDARSRVFRTRIILLLTAGLGAIALGILLGRLRAQGGAGGAPTAAAITTTQAPAPAPRALAERKGEGPPALVAPQPPSEVLRSAHGALAGGRLDEADRLFARALEESDEGTEVHARALLGRARVLAAQGEHERADKVLRHVIELRPNSPEAHEANSVLQSLPPVRRAPIERPRVDVSRPAPSSAPKPEPKPEPKLEAAAPSPSLPTPGPGASDEERCRALVARHLGNAAAGVTAFEDLKKQLPSAPCVYKQLGAFHKQAGHDAAAVVAWRRYLELRPDAPDRKAVEGKIAGITRGGP